MKRLMHLPAIARMFAVLLAALGPFAAPASASGDLLVAPTRLVLDGARGTEVVLNNIGDVPATYRISLELKRMTPAGTLEEIDPATASEAERAALDMIRYSPRRVTLPPNQPQIIRVGVSVPEGLPAGEYRAHMLFRAVPDAAPVVARASAAPAGGVSVALTPIYGVTIPVIIRHGALDAKGAIGRAWLDRDEQGADRFNLVLDRTGNRSIYGEIDVRRPGADKPLLAVRGIAVYPEVATRAFSVTVPPDVAASLKGPVRIRYTEDRELGSGTIAEADRVVE